MDVFEATVAGQIKGDNSPNQMELNLKFIQPQSTVAGALIAKLHFELLEV
jgi:hypothetical protein